MRLRNASHAVFAATMIAIGILGLVKGDYVSLWQPLPHSTAASAYVCALVSLACGIGLLVPRTVSASARMLLLYLLLFLLLVRMPGVLAVRTVDYWWAACKVAVMAAAAWVVYVTYATEWDKRRFPFATGSEGLRAARMLYGAALIPFGIAHFVYLKPTAHLVPAWLPWHMALAFLTGCTFIAAGLAVMTGLCARLAAALVALQIAMFTLLVWVPVVAAGAREAFQWSETVLSTALAVAACLMASSYREASWLAARRSSIVA